MFKSLFGLDANRFYKILCKTTRLHYFDNNYVLCNVDSNPPFS